MLTVLFLSCSLRNIVFFFFVVRWTRKTFWKLKGRGLIGSVVEFYSTLRRVLYGYFLRAPGVRGQVQKQVNESLSKLQGKMVPTNLTRYLTLPKEGLSDDVIRTELDTLANMDHTRWEDGYVSGAVYHGEEDLIKLQTEAYGKFTVANPIHPDVFPGVRKMEAEVVAMVLAMFNAPPGAAGVSTSGGTDSILSACLSARQRGYHEKGITEPEMYVPYPTSTSAIRNWRLTGILQDSRRNRTPSFPQGMRLLQNQGSVCAMPGTIAPGGHQGRCPPHHEQYHPHRRIGTQLPPRHHR